MEKEIKVRKKRFAAFWLTVALVCSLAIPLMVSAATDYLVADIAYNATLEKGDTIKHTLNTCTVTYIEYKNETQSTELEPITLLANETHEVRDYTGTVPAGKRFSKWLVTDVLASGNEPASIRLTAEFVDVYTITFENYDGTELQSSEFAVDETPIFRGETPQKEATAEYTYTFKGWIPAIATVTGTATYTADYTETLREYTITFDTDGGSTVASIKQGNGTAVTAPADPTKEGYTFAGWSPAIPSTMPAEDTVVTAQWTINQYTITFDTDGGSTIDPITQDYNTAVTAPADPTKPGYGFVGWDKPVPSTMPAEDITIKALWGTSYSITYELNGGTNAASNPVSYVEGVGASLAPATMPGYIFDGWYNDPDFNTKADTVGENQSGDVKVYAKFVMGTIETGDYYLTANRKYQLGSARSVSGDSSVYGSGATFYVPSTGSYTFE